MTRSNIYITLTDGKTCFFVADSSSAPEQGYIVENLIIPLLNANDAAKELKIIKASGDSFMEKRTNATYRYIINLQSKTVSFYDENYSGKNDRFIRGKDLTSERYIPYITEKNLLSNHFLPVMRNLVLLIILTGTLFLSSCATSGYGCKGNSKIMTRVR